MSLGGLILNPAEIVLAMINDVVLRFTITGKEEHE